MHRTGRLFVVACVAACASSGGAGGVTITVSPPSATIATGQDDTLTATESPAQSAAVTWSSSDPSIATVSSTGVVHGVTPGTVHITAAVAGASGAATIIVGSAIPIVATVIPSGALAGSAGFQLDVRGQGFAPSSTVLWNGSPRVTTFVSSVELSAAVPASDLATNGTAAVTVTTPAPGGGTTAPLTFTVQSAANGVPVLTGISPPTLLAQSPSFTLTANGSGFVATSTVTWNGTALPTTFVAPFQLTAAVPSGLVALSGSDSVTVISPAPAGGTSAAVTLAVSNPPPGAITDFIPTTLTTALATTLSVRGTKFTPTSIISVNGVARATAFVDTDRVNVSLSAIDLPTPDSLSIFVTTPAPGGGSSAARKIGVLNASSITTVAPTSVAAGGPGFTLTINGTGFTNASVVRWNGSPRATTFVSSTQLTVSISSADIATAGVNNITIVTPNGVSVGIAFGAQFGSLNPIAIIPVPAGADIDHDTFVRDGLLFGLFFAGGMGIYDVGNGIKGGSPSNPQFISQIITNADGLGGSFAHNAWWFHNPVTGQNKYVFVGQEAAVNVGTSSSGDIHIVDVSDLTHPVEVGFLHIPGAGTHNFWMDEANQILYAAYYNGGVIKVDVSGTLSGDMSSRIIKEVTPGGPGNTYVWGVMLANGTLYASDMLSGLWALDPVTLATKGGGNNVPERYTSDLWVNGSTAYTGTWQERVNSQVFGNAIKIWSLDAQGIPALADSLIISQVSIVGDVAVSPSGKILVAVTEGGAAGSGIYVYSLASPTHPVLLAFHPVGGIGVHTGTVVVINGRTYLFACIDTAPKPEIEVYDLTDLDH